MEKLGVMFEGGLGKKGKPLITIDSICFPLKYNTNSCKTISLKRVYSNKILKSD